MKLSNLDCKNAKPSSKVARLTDGHGLVLEIRPKGGKYWRMKYRFAGKEKMLAFGVYPEVTLAEARLKREEARKLLSQNIDPMIVKREKKISAHVNAANTFESLARDWHANWSQDKTGKHVAAILSRFETDVFPHIGALPASSVTPLMILEVIRKVEARAALNVAQRIKQTCGQIFRYGVATGRAERDPTHDIKDAMRPYKLEHFAALDIRELPEFLRVLDKNDMRLYKQTQLAMRLLMFTFVRTSELINAPWSEFDLDAGEWTIPAKRMKMKRDHIVPLSKQALAILFELKKMNGHREWVFPSMTRPRKPMSNATLIRAILRMGYKDRMTGHGFRALAMTTIMEKLPMSMLAGDGVAYREELLSRGLRMAPKANNLLHTYINLSSPKARATCVQRPGWHSENFILPHRVYGAASRERIVLQQDIPQSVLKNQGTLDEWQKHVGALCAGNSRLILAVSAALCGPLLHLLGEENFGLHFYGGSSVGKTTALVVAASIYGCQISICSRFSHHQPCRIQTAQQQ